MTATTPDYTHELTLSREDLCTDMHTLCNRAREASGHGGRQRFRYTDAFDDFEITLQPTSIGFSAGIRLNYRYSPQVNGLFFGFREPIGLPMLIAAGVPESQRSSVHEAIVSFFD